MRGRQKQIGDQQTEVVLQDNRLKGRNFLLQSPNSMRIYILQGLESRIFVDF
jgi:hypothetical protein